MPRKPQVTGIRYSSKIALDSRALDLVEFDRESVSQLVRSHHDSVPDRWLARPEGYQTEGHVLRDSETIRLIAYCSPSNVIYATDGCNTCRHQLAKPLATMSDGDLQALSADTQLPRAMLEQIARIG